MIDLNIGILIGISLVVLAILVYWFVATRRSATQATLSEPADDDTPESKYSPASWPPLKPVFSGKVPSLLGEQIAQRLRNGQKTSAIKLFKEETLTSLVETKKQIEQLEREAVVEDGTQPPIEEQIAQMIRNCRKQSAIKLLMKNTGVDLVEAKKQIEQLEREPVVEDETQPPIEEQIAKLLRNYRKISAIKLFKETTGTNLSEAIKQIEQLEWEPVIEEETQPPIEEQIAQMIRNGRKLSAIKLFMQETGADLVEAKKHIDKLEQLK